MADCGQLVSTEPEPEPEFDPANVTIGQCGQDFPIEGAPGETSDVRVIVTNTNEVTAIADIVVRAGGQEIGRASSVSIASLSNQTVRVTITIPPEGTYAVQADPENITQGAGRAPASAGGVPVATTSEAVRAGAGKNGEHRPISDGGVGTGSTATALARACGGCAERSRKLTATNRRLRRAFDFVGR